MNNVEFICPSCGTPITVPYGVTTCRCGVCKQIVNVPDPEATAYGNTYQQAPYPAGGYAPQPHPAQKGGGGNTAIIVVLVTLLAALIGAGIAYFLINGKGGKTETASSEPVVVHDTVVQTTTIVRQEVAQPAPVATQSSAATTQPARQSSASGQGLYPFASTRRLTEAELRGYSSRELKIMRNEIYARHGYVFQTADMKNYFAAQPWYRPVSRNVSLSSVEQANVATIQRVEATK